MRGIVGLPLPILLLGMLTFGVVTFTLSTSLIKNEASSFAVSPRSLVEKSPSSVQSFMKELSMKQRRSRDHVLPWYFRLRKRREGDHKMLNARRHQPHRPNEAPQQPKSTSDALNITIGDPCGISEAVHKQSQPLNDCSEYPLPFTTDKVPVECWPRIVLLPSYPTSGNELVHIMFQRITGLATFNSFQLGQHAFDLSTDTHDAISIHYDHTNLCGGNNNSLVLPYAGQVALTKTHYRNQPKTVDPNMFYMTHQQQSGDVGGSVAAVVRLARNPGDHLLRNFFRWSNRDCHDACFYKRATKTCRVLESKTSDWNNFHSFWREYDDSIPQLIMHYENFSQRETAYEAFQELIAFVGAEEAEPGTMQAKVNSYVREPTYTQGELVAKVCGIPLARRIHELTKEQSTRLGYKFNDKTGVWSLSGGAMTATLTTTS